MKLNELLNAPICEEYWVDADGKAISEDDLFYALEESHDGSLFESEEDSFEAARRAFRRFGQVIKKQYRCTSGRKKGKLVSNPMLCAQRKDPKKVRHGRKVARMKKGIRIRKTAISKKKAISKMVVRMNKRISGK